MVGGGFLHLATVIDVYSRRLLGRSIANHMRTGRVADGLNAAVRIRGGRVSGSKAFAAACHTAGIRRSMGAVGSSADNAATELFFASLKRETLPGRRGWATEQPARFAVFRRLGFYNHRRRRTAVGYLAPFAFEQRSTTLAIAA
ncbi:transposase [Streptomyces sp. NBC_01794]|uniref:transposase n=1 Tax=Streptomyces sp. NBC_01794 TaxID=2975942 RepID=UPI0038739086